ncbi:hypothetical protein GCM10009619_13720 [Williamsia maris]
MMMTRADIAHGPCGPDGITAHRAIGAADRESGGVVAADTVEVAVAASSVVTAEVLCVAGNDGVIVYEPTNTKTPAHASPTDRFFVAVNVELSEKLRLNMGSNFPTSWVGQRPLRRMSARSRCAYYDTDASRVEAVSVRWLLSPATRRARTMREVFS